MSESEQDRAVREERKRIRLLLEKMASDPAGYFSTPRRLSRPKAQTWALLQAAKRLEDKP